MTVVEKYRIKTHDEMVSSGWMYDPYSGSFWPQKSLSWRPNCNQSMLGYTLSEQDQKDVEVFFASSNTVLTLDGRLWCKDMFHKEYFFMDNNETLEFVKPVKQCECCIFALMRGDGHVSDCPEVKKEEPLKEYTSTAFWL